MTVPMSCSNDRNSTDSYYAKFGQKICKLLNMNRAKNILGPNPRKIVFLFVALATAVKEDFPLLECNCFLLVLLVQSKRNNKTFNMKNSC